MATNAQAQAFKALHIPGKPLLLANVHDALSAGIVGSLPGCQAIATASHSIAMANGTKDADLTLETQLAAIGPIAAVAHKLGKPLTVDLQDGYGDRLEEAVKAVIQKLGAVGINLEDSDHTTEEVMEEGIAVERVKRALKAAAEVGVPDFVVNARSDLFFHGKTGDESELDAAIRRGKLFLEAGATTAFIPPFGMKDLNSGQVKKIVQGLDGKVNLIVRLPVPGQQLNVLNSQDLAKLGVARLSVGPQLGLAVTEAIKAAAGALFLGSQA